jgi:two-component system chemotaxis response regulator CheY
LNLLSPLNILLAEDEAPVAFSICFALKSDGHKIETVTDGEQALARLTAEPGVFDLLITDNNMPRMTGVELVKRVRESSVRCKILVLSAHLSPEKRAEYEALGVDEMMPKPFDLHQLRAAISRIAGKEIESIPEPAEPAPLPFEEVRKLLRLGLDDPERGEPSSPPKSGSG